MDSSVYVRPNKPKTTTVRRRMRDFALSTIDAPELLMVDKSTECHVTPDCESRKMAEYLNLESGMRVLEPQCGTGNLIAALLSVCDGLEIVGVEREYSLHQASSKRFRDNENVCIVRSCFLDYAAEHTACFDCVITNPPFRQAKRHIEASLGMLIPGGTLIGLVPSTFEYPCAYEIERLDRGVFSNTGVFTKIIEIGV